jgi:hypothetical protein
MAEILTGNNWTTWNITIDGGTVRDGLNEVTVCWPILGFDCDRALKKVAMNIYQGKFTEFYPVYGEIHSFTASVSR